MIGEKKTKKVVVFDSDFEEITNSDNKPIGKKVFSLHLKNKEYSQFFVENTDYYFTMTYFSFWFIISFLFLGA